jgi:hypothetical protein
MLPPPVPSSSWRNERSPRVRDDCIAGCPPDLLSCVRVRIGLRDLALADPARQPDIRFLFVGPPARGFGFLQIPPRDGHPCRTLRFRSPRPAEDFHLLNRPMPGTRYHIAPPSGAKYNGFFSPRSGRNVIAHSEAMGTRGEIRRYPLFFVIITSTIVSAVSPGMLRACWSWSRNSFSSSSTTPSARTMSQALAKAVSLSSSGRA